MCSKEETPLDEASDDAAADDDATAAAEEAAAAAAAAEAARARAAGGGGSVDIEVDAALLVAVAVSDGRAECGGASGFMRGTKPIEGEAKGVVSSADVASIAAASAAPSAAGAATTSTAARRGSSSFSMTGEVEMGIATSRGLFFNSVGRALEEYFFSKASKKRENENPLFLISLELQRRRKNENTPRLGNSRNGKKGHVRFSLSLSLFLSVCVVLSVVGQN